MKNLTLFCALLLMLFSCKESPKSTPSVQTPVSDSTAVADVIHGFYKWYYVFVQDTTKHISFLNSSGEHFKLNVPRMDKHFANFSESGFISPAFIKNEYAFYKRCEQLWQNEPTDDVPSGMDADKYYCAQDWEVEFWQNAPVRIKIIGNDSIFATLYDSNPKYQLERNFELKKENGKWLLTKIECDMGVK